MVRDDIESAAKCYDEVHSSWSNLEKIVRGNEFSIFLSHSFRNRNVVEIGLGDGIFTEMLATQFNKVYAVDASTTVLEKVKERLSKYSNIVYIKSFVENLVMEESIDNIIMSHILEHVDDPIRALENVRNLCHSDTIVYLSVPNAMSIHRQVGVKMGLLEKLNSLNEVDVKLGHKRVYYPEELKSDVLKAGFQIIEFGGSMLKPLTNKQIEDTWSNEMIRGFIEVGKDYSELCGDIYIVAKKGD